MATPTTEVELKDLGNDDTTSSILPHVEWTSEHENILVEWADKAPASGGFTQKLIINIRGQMPYSPYQSSS